MTGVRRRRSRRLSASGFGMDFGMSLFLVRPSEFSAANITRKWLFARVRPDVRGQVVTARKRPHANPALERLLTSVDPDVAGQLV